MPDTQYGRCHSGVLTAATGLLLLLSVSPEGRGRILKVWDHDATLVSTRMCSITAVLLRVVHVNTWRHRRTGLQFVLPNVRQVIS